MFIHGVSESIGARRPCVLWRSQSLKDNSYSSGLTHSGLSGANVAALCCARIRVDASHLPCEVCAIRRGN